MEKSYSIGADIGGTNIQFCVLDNEGKLYEFFTIPAEADKGSKQILKNLYTGINNILTKYNNIRFKGVGVGSPGLISKTGKVVTGADNLTGWNGTNIKKFLEKKINIPVYVENDVTSLALGEAKFGAGKNYRNIVCLAFGTGLGGGIIIDNKLYRGKYGYAGEFGHIVVNPNGPKCSCGNNGCLETYASTVGLKRIVKEKLKNKKNSKLIKLADNNINNITPKLLFDEYKKNNKEAIEIINEMGHYLGIGIGIIVNIFDPDIIILAGGISRAGKPLIDLINKYAEPHILRFFKNKLNIKISKFKDKAGVIGTASLVFEYANG